ncbi:MAG: hypothetical protein JJT78_07045 [Leptospira sp.]|nr:hypothetical protein [Leptospira sp.]
MKKIFFLTLLLILLPYWINAKDATVIASIQKNTPESRNAPSIYCLVDENKKYEGFSHRMNGKNLYFDITPTIDTNAIYMIQGVWEKDLTKKIKSIGTCQDEPVMEQIRSDWLAEENSDGDFGIISWSAGGTTRERLQELKFFRVGKLQKVKNFHCRRKAGNLVIVISREKYLEGIPLELISHYESTNGKPSPTFNKYKVSLKKKSNELKIPISLQEGGKGGSRSTLEGITISGEKGNFIVNVKIDPRDCKK